MQLLLILALLLGGGDVDNLLKQAEPLLKNLGGEDLQKTLKQAEELSAIIGGFQKVKSSAKTDSPAHMPEQTGKEGDFALAPVVGIADGDILCALAKYIAENL